MIRFYIISTCRKNKHCEKCKHDHVASWLEIRSYKLGHKILLRHVSSVHENSFSKLQYVLD